MELTEENLAATVKQAIDTFAEELKADQEERLDRIIQEKRAALARCAWKSAQKWCKWDDEGPVLMPDFTRIYYRKGSSEILLQELPPQVRLLRFVSSMVERSNSSEDIPRERRVLSFSLALPYTVFIFKFNDGVFEKLYCAFSDRPLKRLEEKPLRPFFSNIDGTLKVCLGNDFRSRDLIANNLTQQASYILDYFWNSVFTEDWSSHFWNYRSHFQQNDERLATLENWQENSFENPLFVVEDVDWLPSQEESFGNILANLLHNENQNNSLMNDMYEEIAESILEEVKKNCEDSVSELKARIVEDLVQNALEQEGA